MSKFPGKVFLTVHYRNSNDSFKGNVWGTVLLSFQREFNLWVGLDLFKRQLPRLKYNIEVPDHDF